MTDATSEDAGVEEPCIDATDLVEDEIDLEDEPYEEVIVLDLRAVADDLWLN